MQLKKVLKLAKGFYGRNKNCNRIARERVEKSLQYAYVSRRLNKRDQRSNWITQINAGTRLYGTKYSDFVRGLAVSDIGLNRKMLADLAINEPYSFKALVDHATQSLVVHKAALQAAREKERQQLNQQYEAQALAESVQ